MAKLSIVSEPSGRVVSAESLRLHARIDDPSEDSSLEQLLDVAEDEAEDYTWRKFLTQTWDQYYDGFEDPLHLRWPSVSSITSIGYTDANGDAQTLSTDVYELGEEYGLSVVRRKYNQDWPTTRGHEDVVTVRFVVGYGDAEDVPDAICQAIRIHAAWAYRNREGQPMPDGFRQLLSPYRAMKWQPIGV